jgi:hypothetical protein
MRRFCLTAILGVFAVLVSATPAAAQGWGLGIFAKWSGPGDSRVPCPANAGCSERTGFPFRLSATSG